jgi:CheY-like chemotaxis protein
MSARILIAEDDEMQGAALRTVLACRGYEAENVTDGLEAVRRLRAGRY